MSVEGPKNWFEKIVNVFMHVRSHERTHSWEFSNELTEFVNFVLKASNQSIDLGEYKFEDVLHHTVKCIFERPADERVTALATSELFRLLIDDPRPLKHATDQTYYKNHVLKVLFGGYSRQTGIDVSFIESNENAVNWICVMSERLLTQSERNLLCEAHKEVPVEAAVWIQSKAREIEKKITSKDLCDDVQWYLMGIEVGDVTPPAVLEIYKEYDREILQSASQKFHPIIKNYLIQSLGIWGRMLPSA